MGAATETHASDPSEAAVGRPERTAQRAEVARPTTAGRNDGTRLPVTVTEGAREAGAVPLTAIVRRVMGPDRCARGAGGLTTETVRLNVATTGPEVEGAESPRSAAVPG